MEKLQFEGDSSNKASQSLSKTPKIAGYIFKENKIAKKVEKVEKKISIFFEKFQNSKKSANKSLQSGQ